MDEQLDALDQSVKLPLHVGSRKPVDLVENHGISAEPEDELLPLLVLVHSCEVQFAGNELEIVLKKVEVLVGDKSKVEVAPLPVVLRQLADASNDRLDITSKAFALG